jgi:probable DNA metabolism protein
MLLIYEDNWEGFLTAVFEAYPLKGEISLISARKHEPSLLDFREVPSDEGKALRLERGMRRLGSDTPICIYRAWLSEKKGIEDDILTCLRLGFTNNCDPLALHSNASVHRVALANSFVGMERQRFMGLIRLVHIQEDLYAADFWHEANLLPLMGEHFHMRFNDQRIVIRDRERGFALITGPEGWELRELPEEWTPLPKGGEFETMWKRYFETISNPARKNLKLQQKFVPLKHRALLTEFQE